MKKTDCEIQDTKREILDMKQFIVHFLDYSRNGENNMRNIAIGFYLASAKVAKEFYSMISTINVRKRDGQIYIPKLPELVDDMASGGVVSLTRCSTIKLANRHTYIRFHNDKLNLIRNTTLDMGNMSEVDYMGHVYMHDSWKKAEDPSLIDFSDDMVTDEEVEAVRETLKEIPEFK